MDFDRTWKSIAAGLCGSAAHTALMALKSWAGILPSFRPYDDLQALLTNVIGNSVEPHDSVGAVVFQWVGGARIPVRPFYQVLPGRTGIVKGMVFGLAVWLAMGLIFFPAIGKGWFAAQTGLGIAPTFFTLVMVLTYSVTLGVAYAVFTSKTRGYSP